MRILMTLAVLLAGALTAGCHFLGDRTVTADEAMDGKRITVHSGDVIELKLPENPSTGYRWLSTDDSRPALLTEMGSTYIGDAAASGIVGAGGTRIWRYRADHIGECTLQFGLVPPGRSPGPEDDRYRITVVVAD